MRRRAQNGVAAGARRSDVTAVMNEPFVTVTWERKEDV
jgi:hypothetical protein